MTEQYINAIIVISMLTTSLFYASMLGNLVGRVLTIDPAPLLPAVYFSWLLDSLFNDVCVVTIGFGPIAGALAAIGPTTGVNADRSEASEGVSVAAEAIGASMASRMGEDLSTRMAL